jgi:signal peptidase I
VVAVLVRGFAGQAFRIPSESMVPQLHVGDRVIASKLAYRLHDPRRGDVLVFACPPAAGCPQAAPRSAPGRTVDAVLEAVLLRQPRGEAYIKRVIGLPGERVEGRAGAVWVDGRRLTEPYLPEGMVTSDFPPTRVPAGSLWVMGDNRTGSSDSRVFGPIRRDSVVGRAIWRVWPVWNASFL